MGTRGLFLGLVGMAFAFSAHASVGFQFADLLSNLTQGYIYDHSGKVLKDDKVASDEVAWTLLSSKEAAKYNSVGMLFNLEPKALCTAVLINAGGDKDAPAYALTAAHCVRNMQLPDMPVGQVWGDVPIHAGLFLNSFADTKNDKEPVIAKQFVYGNRKGYDIAVLELNETYNKLAEKGYRGLKLSRTPLKAGEKISLVGIPVKGLGEESVFLRRADCSVRALSEGGLGPGEPSSPIMVQRKGILHDCSAVQGASGAPLIRAENDEVVGVMSWIRPNSSLLTDGLLERFKDYNGGSNIEGLADCFDSTGRFDLNLPACRFEKPCTGTELACASAMCKKGNGRSCFEVALRLSAADPEKNKTQVGKFVEKACALRDNDACEFIGDVIFSEGKIDRKHVPQGIASFRTACDSGSATACYKMGQLFREGMGVPKSDKTARSFFSRACEMGNAFACDQMTEAHRNKTVEDASDEKAANYAIRACVGQSRAGCANLGLFLDEGIGLPCSADDAIRYYQVACDSADGSSCFRIGKLLIQKGDLTKASQYFQQACALGHQEACPEK